MKRRLSYMALLLAVLLVLPLSLRAAQQVRAKPVLRGDKEYNAILLHVAQYFVLTIPDGKSVEDISRPVSCSFVIAPNGALQQLEIENAGVGIFEDQAARRTEMWLRTAVLDGMHGIPAFDMSQIRSAKSAKKRTVVFTFGKSYGGGPVDVPTMGANTHAMQNNMNRSLQEQLQDIRDGKEDPPTLGMSRAQAERRYLRQDKSWAGFADENIKSTMKPKYDPYPSGLPVIKGQPKVPPLPGDSIPRIEVAVTLQ